VQDNPWLQNPNLPSASVSTIKQIDELQQLYDEAPCGYHSLDANGVFVRVNQAELNMLGYSREELLGHKTFFEILTPDSQQIFTTNFPLFKQRGYIRDLEFQIIRKDNSIFPVSLSATAIKDSNGNYLVSRSVMIDISDRKQLEAQHEQTTAELRNSEARYRLLFESNPNPMWIYDPESLRFLEVNQAAIDHYGYSVAEFLQMTITDIRPAEDTTALHQFNFCLLPGKSYSGTGKHRKKSGELIDVEVMAHAFSVAGKQANLVLVKDITILQQNEAALNLAHQRIIDVWESITDAYVTLDRDWRFIYANSAAMQLFGQLSSVETSTIIGRVHWEVFPETLNQQIEWNYRRAVAKQIPVHFESLDETSGHWVEISAYPSEVGLGIYFRDITDRKQAEQKIREQANLLAITSDAIYVHDLENRILFWNQGAEKLYDCPTDEMIDQDWRQLLSSPEALLELENTVSNQNTWQGELTKRTQSGKEIVVMSRRSVMLDDAGNIKSILTVDTDITEKKHLESQFLRAQRLESLGMLASGIAHDLNNVLTPIIGIVQLLPLKITNLDPQIQRLLEILNDSAHRGADLVKQILSFTRGIEGKPSNVQIGHLIAETQKIIQETFPKNIDLLVDLPSDLWLASADATLLHQVFLNLCVNARDAMPKGGNLSITAENLEIDENYARMNLDAEAGSYVVVTIADTGMGIPPDIVDRIFDPFFTTKDVGKGTGLGLSTVMGVIKSHHGFISVYSEIGKGTRFKVYLPASDDSTIDPTIKNELLFGNGELILVVDDETAVQEVTKATLETHGYQTILANDGIEAIALYAENKTEISAVLLDMMMPSLDSVTIIRTLHKLNPQVQIVAMSGLATNESVIKMTNDGVKAFLAKPFTAHELLQPLAVICRQNSDGSMI
jgi:PAS domain S-box-containing protein